MPMRFELGPDSDHCTVRIHGIITLADLEAGINAQISHNAWTRRLLVDTTDATGILVRWNDVAALVRFVGTVSRGLPRRGRTVLPAPHDVVVGFAQMYQRALQQSSPDIVIEIVRTREEAEARLSAV